MSSGMRTGLAVLVLVLLVAAGLTYSRMAPQAVPELDLVRSKATAEDLYIATITPEEGEPTVGPLHSWVLAVTTADGTPVEGASISVDGGMPEHAHGLPTAPQVTAVLGEGRYRIEGVKFSMPGWWELKVTIAGPQGTDATTFNLML
jgi:hypothetical protein